MLAEKTEKTRITYKEYAQLKDDIRREVIDGVIHLLMPGASCGHQAVVLELARLLSNHLKGHRCKVMMAPFDVRLNPHDKDDNVFQPDVMIICDPRKLENGKHCLGAPDMVFEVLSPSTDKRDKVLKLPRYFEHGVKECWLIDPVKETVLVYKLNEVKDPDEDTADEVLDVHLYENKGDPVIFIELIDLEVKVSDLFTE